MSKPLNRCYIQAQRRSAGAWISTDNEPHRAQRWAVVQPHKGRTRVTSAWPTRAEALAVCDSTNRRNRPKAHATTPGERYGPAGVRGKGTIIARSLYEQERS